MLGEQAKSEADILGAMLPSQKSTSIKKAQIILHFYPPSHKYEGFSPGHVSLEICHPRVLQPGISSYYATTSTYISDFKISNSFIRTVEINPSIARDRSLHGVQSIEIMLAEIAMTEENQKKLEQQIAAIVDAFEKEKYDFIQNNCANSVVKALKILGFQNVYDLGCFSLLHLDILTPTEVFSRMVLDPLNKIDHALTELSSIIAMHPEDDLNGMRDDIKSLKEEIRDLRLESVVQTGDDARSAKLVKFGRKCSDFVEKHKITLKKIAPLSSSSLATRSRVVNILLIVAIGTVSLGLGFIVFSCLACAQLGYRKKTTGSFLGSDPSAMTGKEITRVLQQGNIEREQFLSN